VTIVVSAGMGANPFSILAFAAKGNYFSNNGSYFREILNLKKAFSSEINLCSYS